MINSSNGVDSSHLLNAIDMGINTHQEPVVYMRSDCHICHAEGFSANSRVKLSTLTGSIIATLNVVDNEVLQAGQVGLSKIAFHRLGLVKEAMIRIEHAPVVSSLSKLRKKIFGETLDRQDMQSIINDISLHRYRDIEIASFLSVCAGNRLDLEEIIGLTQAMVDVGKRLKWPNHTRIFDKHCIGGIPGNRTTPLVVSIVSAAGLIMPKTSSRAITSPAGTADTMETLTNVDLSLEDITRVVDSVGACLVWGGAVNLSPADDMLIRIERALDLDGEGQLVASVLSKKIAAGSTHAIIDIPIGKTAKVRGELEANRLAALFTQVGEVCGIHVRCIITDGSRPIGTGIGPVEEAKDILAILQLKPDAPQDLRERAVELSAHLLDLAEGCGLQKGRIKANNILDSGAAWSQFEKIVNAQGGFKSLPNANYSHTENAPCSGVIHAIDNRKLSRLAKLAGAPFSASSGIRLYKNAGDSVISQQPLFCLYSASTGERDYALGFYRDNPDIFVIGEN